ncbi:MAG TPA: carboxypeptidase-like regulatory domain-containing protein [Pyrinomonadaceae bacterium]|nr:carboxypeptidase-like regulatory domain-containing protein [Pyrinomonadaceae bacterium]
MRPHRLPIIFLILLSLITAGSEVRGQIAAGTIVGTTQDEQGAIIPTARVTVTNTQTGLVRQLTSDGDGSFTAAQLPPGVKLQRRDGREYRGGAEGEGETLRDLGVSAVTPSTPRSTSASGQVFTPTK